MNKKQIVNAIKKANFVYIIGNGGSASTANHFANDLMKMAGIKAVSLCSNEAVVMAFANDHSYDEIFVDQLRILMEKNDLLITLSGSGTSKNIVKAIEELKQIDFNVCSFPTMAELKLDMQETEDYHLKLVHQIAKDLAR